MHFHLPKPLHGWREFVGEVSVIVLGVAIALAAEQVVEQAHWHNATREAVENMKQDAVGERYALLARYDQRDCIDRRLDEIGALLARHDAGQPIGRVRRVSRPFYSYGTAPSWQVAVADGSVAHLSFAQRREFAAAFDAYSVYENQRLEEKHSWQQLQMLDDVASFTPADWSQARQAFKLASDFEASFRITLPEYLGKFRAFATAGPNPESRPNNPFKTDLCRPLLVAASQASAARS
jgi:hypothetical protein